MNSESAIFSSPSPVHKSATSEALTKRLYPLEKNIDEPYVEKEHMTRFAALDELKRLASKLGMEDEKETSSFIADQMGVSHKATDALEKKISTFHASQREHSLSYWKRERQTDSDFLLYYFHGYDEPLPYPEAVKEGFGGLFLRLGRMGIAINPGRHFLAHFHEKGLHIKDIDIVLVTNGQKESFHEVQEIYELTSQGQSFSPKGHHIKYYLHYKAYQALSLVLKPHSKQDREALHSLEFFKDSPDEGSFCLDKDLTLKYFPLGEDSLGFRLEYSSLQEKISIGYISKGAWNPFLAHHLGICDILIAGFGNTTPSDYNKISYNKDSLGYYGIFTLLEDVSPSLLLFGEVHGSQGDIRMEILQKLRSEYSKINVQALKKHSVIIPADIDLQVCLKTLQVKSSSSDEWIDSSKIKTIRKEETFGKLLYLSSDCCC